MDSQAEVDESKKLKASTFTTRPRRRVRIAVDTYTIDTVVFVDFSAYKFLSHGLSDTVKVMNDILEYVAFIMEGVDANYQTIATTNYTIRVKLIRIVVAKVLHNLEYENCLTAEASPFTEKHKSAGTPWELLNTEAALKDFQEFIAKDGVDVIKQYDHTVLFSAYNLATFSNGTSDSLVGLAALRGLCSVTGESSSIVEIIYEFSAITTTTHEMGHNLGAPHDGEYNNCTFQDRYIMASSNSPETPMTQLNPWRFSPCSISYFTSFINTLLESPKSACLTGTLVIEDSVPKVKGLYPGLNLSPDQQCLRVFGEGSSMCRIGKPEDICRTMMCRRPGTQECTELTIAPGSLCGSGKVCKHGECINHPDAPLVPDDCVFGDTLMPLSDGRRCNAAITADKSTCYEEHVRQYCCESCEKIYRTVHGCEYGDLASRCIPAMCDLTFPQRNSCCKTCNLGTPFTTMAPLTRPTRLTSTRSLTNGSEYANHIDVISTAGNGNKVQINSSEESLVLPYVIVLCFIALAGLAVFSATYFFWRKASQPPVPRVKVELLKFTPEPVEDLVESRVEVDAQIDSDEDDADEEGDTEEDDEEEETPT